MAERMDYPSNSHSSRQTREAKSTPEQAVSATKPTMPVIKKVVNGTVTRQKKGVFRRIAQSFIGDETRNVGEFILLDVIIPSAKEMIEELVKGSIELILFGEKRGPSSRKGYGRPSYTSYNSYYQNSDPRNSKREISRSGRARHDFDEIILDSRGEAEEVLSSLVDLVVDYQMASVGDLYELLGIPANFTDNKYGWTDLRGASVSRVKGGYRLDLPKAILLD